MGKLETELIGWLKYRSPTVEGEIYSIKNPSIIFKNSGIIKLTDGTTFYFNRQNKLDILRIVFFALENGIRFGQNENQWKIDQTDNTIETPQKIKFYIKRINSDIFAETFLYDVHFIDFDMDGKTVIEAGAFVGDTALYYASKGAMVYSFEPDLESYEIAKENISLNKHLSQNISLTNYAIGKDGEVDFPVIDATSAGSSVFISDAKFRKVRSVSVRTILREFDINNPYLLHLDIKGLEFSVINDNALSEFDRIRIEYSPYFKGVNGESIGNLSVLLQKLREYGFKHIRTFKHSNLRYDLLNHGTIDAMK